MSSSPISSSRRERSSITTSLREPGRADVVRRGPPPPSKPVAIFSEFRQFGANLELIAPAAFISLVVPLALFFAFQRYFVEGLLAGSVK